VEQGEISQHCKILRYLCGALLTLSMLANPVAAQTTSEVGALKKLAFEELLNLEITTVSRRPERLLDAPSAIQDLKLPLMSGHDVLAWIRKQREFESLVVIVLTSSNEASDLSRCYALGANSYLVKPPTPEQLDDLAKAFKWYWLEYNQFDDR
jgi:CheY-like chemotaxis protein